MGTATSNGSAAHVLRRTGFGPYPGQVQAAVAAGGSLDDLIDRRFETVLAFEPNAALPDEPGGGPVDIDQPDTPSLRYRRRFKQWWLVRMLDDDAALHEKMLWFWHGHFTTDDVKVDSTNLCWRQLRTLHEQALGNFGDLARQVTIDGAMLKYLDGDGSKAQNPNENYARELMELFTLGVGHYTQADVTAAARALAGYYTDRNLDLHRSTDVLKAPVRFLGRRVQTAMDVVDTVLDHQACGPYVVGRLWRSLIGGKPDRALVTRWGRQFQRSGYEIEPLLRTMLHSEAFADATGSRARTPVEWYCAAVRAADADRDHVSDLATLAQVPYTPPNVSGWPGDDAWLTTTQTRSRAMLAQKFAGPTLTELGADPDPVAAMLGRCSITEVGPTTRAALDRLAADLAGASPAVRGASLFTAVVLSPEASLA